MSDHADEEDGHEPAHESGYETARSTAPQTPYTNRQVGIGLAIALAGIFLVFAVPILLA